VQAVAPPNFQRIQTARGYRQLLAAELPFRPDGVVRSRNLLKSCVDTHGERGHANHRILNFT